ncbi:MAG: hypothetical protein HYT39_01625 [Candidatus Sungbacteria bacterium]|nr:hypothetical protein [Candidatus Sungbacteria bacterium]
MSLEQSSELPIGAGKREAKMERIPAVEVKNEVAWVNPHIHAPFDVEEGKPTKLGIFATTHEESKDTTVEGVVGHGRSAILGQVIFEDDKGEKYRDVDIKGLGSLTYWDGGLLVNPVHEVREGVVRGILDYAIALKDASMAEAFSSSGIRTYRVIAITKLKEIVTNFTRNEPQEKISIEEAKKLLILPLSSDPALEIRAFGTRERIADLSIVDPKYKTPTRNSFEDARLMVSQELEIPEQEFTPIEYVKWFANTLGENVARMHTLGFAHGYLTRHNITLDCRIIDLDSVERPRGYPEESDLSEIIDAVKASPHGFDGIDEHLFERFEGKPKTTYAKDMFTAIVALHKLHEFAPVKNKISFEEIMELFRQSYMDVLQEPFLEHLRREVD